MSKRVESEHIAGMDYYQQSGGCIEASVQNDTACDILHFCGKAEALVFIAEFSAFVEQCTEDDGSVPDGGV